MKRHHNLFLVLSLLAAAGGFFLVGASPALGFPLLFGGLGGFVFLQRAGFFVFLANRRYMVRDWDGTLGWFRRGAATGRLDADASATFLYLLLRAGLVDEAEAWCDQVLADGVKGRGLKTPERRLLLAHRSLVLWKRGRLDEAVEVLEELLAAGYRTMTLYGNLGFFLTEKGDLDRAEVLCDEALEWDPEGKLLLDNRAAVHLARGQADQAVEVYRRLLPLEPKFPEAWYGAGKAFAAVGETEEARRCFGRALELPFHALTTVSRETVEAALGAL